MNECNDERKKSLPAKKVTTALPELKFTAEGSRVHLCKNHYREFKKATKSERGLDRLGMSSGK